MADARLLLHIIDIDVGIGGEGIVTARQLAAGVGDLVGIRGEVELLQAAERLGGKFERSAVEDVDARAEDLAVEFGVIGMRNVFHEVVPVAVHQAFNGAGGGFLQVRIDVDRLLRDLELADIHHIAAVGVDLELGNAAGDVAYAAGTCAVCVHHVHLAAEQVSDALAALDPAGIRDALGRVRQLAVVRAVDVHHEEVAVASVLLNRGIGNAIEYLLAVGRDLQVGDLAHLVHDFGCEMTVDDGDVVLFEHRFFGRFLAAGTHKSHDQ